MEEGLLLYRKVKPKSKEQNIDLVLPDMLSMIFQEVTAFI